MKVLFVHSLVLCGNPPPLRLAGTPPATPGLRWRWEPTTVSMEWLLTRMALWYANKEAKQGVDQRRVVRNKLMQIGRQKAVARERRGGTEWECIYKLCPPEGSILNGRCNEQHSWKCGFHFFCWFHIFIPSPETFRNINIRTSKPHILRKHEHYNSNSTTIFFYCKIIIFSFIYSNTDRW